MALLWRSSQARVLLAFLAAGGLAVAGGASAHSPQVASHCSCAKSRIALKLVLSDVLPGPRASGYKGMTLEVVSSYHGNEMTFPRPHPSDAVCEIFQHRSSDGTAIAVYKVLRRTTITFSSTYTHVTEAGMPYMGGRLLVARRRRSS